MKITSAVNPKIKAVIKLRERRARMTSGLTVIEGIREVRAAVEAKVVLQELFVCRKLYEGQGQGNVEDRLLRPLLAQNVPVYEVTEDLFAKISFGDRHEGVLAVGKPKTLKLAELKLGAKPLVLLVEHIEKPGNLGAILRTCDAAGIEALFISDPATDIYNPNVIRASLGTVFTVPLIQEDQQVLADYFQKQKMQILATTPSASARYTQADLKLGTVIAVGSEKDGLSDFWMKMSSLKVKVPMKGQADSLNTSVTAAILVYEALRQREG